MERIFTPFEALVTNWRSNVFFRARIKLTAMYMVVMCVVTALFSITLFVNISGDIRESLSSNLPHTIDPDRFFEDRDTSLLNAILFVDGTILFVSGLLSYSVAGYTLKPIKETLDAQERFAADAAHELRTPLAIIQTQIDVLLRSGETIPRKTKETLASISEEARTLSGITKNLLLEARSGADTHHHEEVRLAELITSTVKEFQLLAAEKQITLAASSVPDLTVVGNKDGVRRILINLLDNALKYTETQGHVTIHVETEGPRMVRMEVQDDGRGIPKADLPHIFERFYKVDQTRHSVGTGLGLSIVKELVESFGGTIHATSQVGHGTRMVVRFLRSSL